MDDLARRIAEIEKQNLKKQGIDVEIDTDLTTDNRDKEITKHLKYVSSLYNKVSDSSDIDALDDLSEFLESLYSK